VNRVSVLITFTVQGDTAKFRDALADRADEFATFAERAKESGAIHHR
jgi:hypothetical protein